MVTFIAWRASGFGSTQKAPGSDEVRQLMKKSCVARQDKSAWAECSDGSAVIKGPEEYKPYLLLPVL